MDPPAFDELTGNLELSLTASAIMPGACFVLVVVVLAFVAARRGRFRAEVIRLETFRVLIALAIALTLLQPEWKQTFQPEHRGTVAVLIDTSKSMQTPDSVAPGAASTESNTPLSRADIAAAMADEATWSSLNERFNVVIDTFNSTLPQQPEEATDIQAALDSVCNQHPHLRAVVLVSDGDWNAGGSPTQAATRLRVAEVPVFALATGSTEALPDIALTGFHAPIFAVAGKPVRIPVTIDSTLPRDEPLTLELSASNTPETATTLRINAPARDSIDDSLLWHPTTTGEIELTLRILPSENETYTDNNTLSASVTIREERLRVLLLETYPRWEYRYLRNALQRDPGVTVDCLLLHPDIATVASGPGYLEAFPDQATLAGYDVVFLGDIGIAPGQLSETQTGMIRNLVRDQAAGLVFLPGLHGFQHTLLDSEISELIPVTFDTRQPNGWGAQIPGRFVLTEAGTRSLLTRLEDDDTASTLAWSRLPGFHWYAAALRSKVGSETLATHNTQTTRFGRVPLMVTRTFGAGKILYMGSDSAWRWRKGIEDRYHYRFWGQVVRWMAYQRNMAVGEKMRLFYSPERPRQHETITLNANVMASSGEPLEDGIVIAEIKAPNSDLSTIRLASAGEDSWGLFSASFTPQEAGIHKLRLSCAQSGSPVELDIPVRSASRERLGQPARPDVLAEIAQLTRGTLLPASQSASVLASIVSLPERDPEIRRLPLWAHPAWAGMLLLLLAVFWILRKRAGLF
jgi:hypothetical protein